MHLTAQSNENESVPGSAAPSRDGNYVAQCYVLAALRRKLDDTISGDPSGAVRPHSKTDRDRKASAHLAPHLPGPRHRGLDEMLNPRGNA